MSGGFDSLGLMPELVHAIEDMNWLLPTDVQDEAIPLILGGGDVMAAAETGTGKTAAFALPVIQCVHERLRDILQEASKVKSSAYEVVVLNKLDKDLQVAIDESGLAASASPEKWFGCRSTHGIKLGLYMFECTVHGSGLARVGWATMAANHEIGKDSFGFGYGVTGMKSNCSNFTSFGEKYGNGDVIGTFINRSTREIYYTKNGKQLGLAFSLPQDLNGVTMFPAISLKGGNVTVNFGATPFLFPSGYAGYTGMQHATPQHLVSAISKEAYAVVGKRIPLAVILEPVRDLAEQVYQAILSLSQYIVQPRLNTILLVGGGMDGKAQKLDLKGDVDIVVGTPGKVADLVKSKLLDFSQVKFFILDEADRLIETDNFPTIMNLYDACPAGGTGDNRLQVCFFSATLHSPAITALSTRICCNPTWVDLKGKDSVPDTVHHVQCIINPTVPLPSALRQAAQRVTTALLTDGIHAESGQACRCCNPVMPKSDESYSQRIKELKLLALIGIIDKFKMSSCLIFCRTNVDCDNLETFLCSHGNGRKFTDKQESGKEHVYSCCVLAGMRSMDDRRRNLDAFREGCVRFLICTDVAARGIDIEGLPYVINMTLPDEPELYMHRIGRVGRAGKMGLAISLVVSGEGGAASATSGGCASAAANLSSSSSSPSSSCREKVWYHKCNNRGKGCSNTTLVTAGGCTIWYDEQSCLRQIETRISQPIEALTESFDLPPSLAEQGILYGDTCVNETAAAVSSSAMCQQHFELLRPTVLELAQMEFTSQNIFLAYQTRFA